MAIYERGHIRTDSGDFRDKGNYAIDVTHPDFGARGDDSSDDTRAVIAAFRFAVEYSKQLTNGKGVTVRFPPGRYLVGDLPWVSINANTNTYDATDSDANYLPDYIHGNLTIEADGATIQHTGTGAMFRFWGQPSSQRRILWHGGVLLGVDYEEGVEDGTEAIFKVRDLSLGDLQPETMRFGTRAILAQNWLSWCENVNVGSAKPIEFRNQDVVLELQSGKNSSIYESGATGATGNAGRGSFARVRFSNNFIGGTREYVVLASGNAYQAYFDKLSGNIGDAQAIIRDRSGLGRAELSGIHFEQGNAVPLEWSASTAYAVAGAAPNVAAGGSNVGNGTVGSLAATGSVLVGDWILTAVAASADGGEFRLTNPNGHTYIDSAFVGVAYEAGGLSFTIADGSTDFSVGDTFSITVAASTIEGDVPGYESPALAVHRHANYTQYVEDRRFQFECVVAGTSGATEPDWSTAPDVGNQVADGTVTWENVGPVAGYILDATGASAPAAMAYGVLYWDKSSGVTKGVTLPETEYEFYTRLRGREWILADSGFKGGAFTSYEAQATCAGSGSVTVLANTVLGANDSYLVFMKSTGNAAYGVAWFLRQQGATTANVVTIGTPVGGSFSVSGGNLTWTDTTGVERSLRISAMRVGYTSEWD